jgi:predicted SnoaL-like aldol condensation-catalyzing enzyme
MLRSVYGLIFCLLPALAYTAESNNPANEQVVLRFSQALDQSIRSGTLTQDVAGIATRYLREDFIEHRAGEASGRQAFIDSHLRIGAHLTANPNYEFARVVEIMSKGDRVILLTHRDHNPANLAQKVDLYIFNMYRIENGQVAEHWEAMSVPLT